MHRQTRRTEPRSVRHVRLSPAEWRLIEAAAAAEWLAPSTWLREVAVREARRQIAEADREAA